LSKLDNKKKYDVNYFLNMHKKMQYDPNEKEIQYPRKKSKIKRVNLIGIKKI